MVTGALIGMCDSRKYIQQTNTSSTTLYTKQKTKTTMNKQQTKNTMGKRIQQHPTKKQIHKKREVKARINKNIRKAQKLKEKR